MLDLGSRVDLGSRRDAVVIGPRFGLPWEGQPVELLVLRPGGLFASRANVRRAALALTFGSAGCVVAVTQPRRRMSKLNLLLQRSRSHAIRNFRTPQSHSALKPLTALVALFLIMLQYIQGKLPEHPLRPIMLLKNFRSAVINKRRKMCN
jgi:hypothetical protein